MTFGNSLIEVRSMIESDLAYVRAWRNNADVRRFMLTQHEITAIEHNAWFEQASRDQTRALLIIEECNLPIGCVIFSNVKKNSIADWSFYSAPESPAGTGRRICCSALDFAFNELEIGKVVGQVLEFNVASIRIHQYLGFKQEIKSTKHVFVDGSKHDLLCFGLSSDGWASRRLLLW